MKAAKQPSLVVKFVSIGQRHFKNPPPRGKLPQRAQGPRLHTSSNDHILLAAVELEDWRRGPARHVTGSVLVTLGCGRCRGAGIRPAVVAVAVVKGARSVVLPSIRVGRRRAPALELKLRFARSMVPRIMRCSAMVAESAPRTGIYCRLR
jgi:hypothetical protein